MSPFNQRFKLYEVEFFPGQPLVGSSKEPRWLIWLSVTVVPGIGTVSGYGSHPSIIVAYWRCEFILVTGAIHSHCGEYIVMYVGFMRGMMKAVRVWIGVVRGRMNAVFSNSGSIHS